jgi:AraC-like DNA-binding protein
MHMTSTPPQAATSARLLRPFMTAIARAAGSVRLPAFAAGIDLNSWDERVPHGVVIALLERAIDVTGDTDLGLHAVEAFNSEDFDVLDYAIASCETVGDAISTVNRYLRLLHDAAQLELDVEGEIAVWSFGVSGDLPWYPQCSDFVAGLLLYALRRAAGAQLGLREVRLRHPAPAQVSEYTRVFRAPVRFGAAEDALVFDSSTLGTRVETYDPALCRVMRQHAEMLMQRLPPAPRFRDQVQALIRSQLESGQLNLEQVAKRLGVSERTLRRRLEHEETSYLELLEDVRCELALRWLSRSNRPIGEIAFVLGFSRTPSFYKAFRRWTGMTPARYRAAQTEKSGVRATELFDSAATRAR